jgi:hypothetical protein
MTEGIDVLRLEEPEKTGYRIMNNLELMVFGPIDSHKQTTLSHQFFRDASPLHAPE